MPRFLILYNSSSSAREQMANATPEQAKAGMEAWMSWAQEAGQAIVDLGTPLQPVAHLGAGGGAAASGYSILEGERTQIEALLAEHPHLQMPDASIDLLEALPIPGA